MRMLHARTARRDAAPCITSSPRRAPLLQAYQLFVQEVLRLDPSGAILSYKDMMDKQVRPRRRVRLPRAMSTCHVSCPKPRHIRGRPPAASAVRPPASRAPHPALISLTQIVMPAELMAEPSNPNLYDDFARVATDLNVYTGVDYAEIIEHLNEFWKIGEVPTHTSHPIAL